MNPTVIAHGRRSKVQLALIMFVVQSERMARVTQRSGSVRRESALPFVTSRATSDRSAAKSPHGGTTTLRGIDRPTAISDSSYGGGRGHGVDGRWSGRPRWHCRGPARRSDQCPPAVCVDFEGRLARVQRRSRPRPPAGPLSTQNIEHTGAVNPAIKTPPVVTVVLRRILRRGAPVGHPPSSSSSDLARLPGPERPGLRIATQVSPSA